MEKKKKIIKGANLDLAPKRFPLSGCRVVKSNSDQLGWRDNLCGGKKKKEKESLVLITHTQTQTYMHYPAFSLTLTLLHARRGHVNALGTTELRHTHTHAALLLSTPIISRRLELIKFL